MAFIKCVLILAFIVILFQDIKERMVTWFLFPLVAICCSTIHYNETLPELFLSSVLFNLILVSVFVIIIYLYSRFKLLVSFNKAIGLGDICLFYAMSLAFSSVTFLVLFISSLIFSLVIHSALKKEASTVPLAGYISLFLVMVYTSHWTGLINSIYTI